MVSSQRHDPGSVCNDEGVVKGDEGLSVASSCRRERHLEVVDPADLQRLKLQPQLPGCRLGVLPEDGMPYLQRIPEHGDPGKQGHKLLEELHALGDEVFIGKAQPRHIPPGVRQARH